MGIRSSTIYGLLSVTLFAAFGIATSEARSIGYLAKVGPVALRFQPARTSKQVILPPLPKDGRKVPADNTKTPDDKTVPPQPVTESMTSPQIPLPGAPLTGVLDGSGPDSLLPAQTNYRTNSPASIPSANDLLVITPQMLADYFRPARGATNGANVNVLVPVDFMPPTPPAPHSSSATYKTQ